MMSGRDGWFFIDLEGKESFRVNYRQDSKFSGGRTFLEKARNKYILLDQNGNQVSSSLFTDFQPYTAEGIAVASLDNRYYYFNRMGQKIFDQGFEEANSYEKEVARVKEDDGWYLIDARGNGSVSILRKSVHLLTAMPW